MTREKLIRAILILSAILAAEVVFVGVRHVTDRQAPDYGTEPVIQTTDAPTETTEAPTTPVTEPRTTEPDPTETEPEETEPEETEPQEQRYTLTFVGDCTLGSTPSGFYSSSSFVGTVGDDYDFPFRKVREYFENDDFTMVNLESVLSDSGTGAADKTFVFRGPTAYTQILTGSSVEAVTLANNHTMDFGKTGYRSTKDALTDAGVPYVEANGTMLYTTDSGLTIGVYATCFTVNEADLRSDIAALRSKGAEIIIAAMHWGTEGSYRVTSSQKTYARLAIDAGADIVYGHHPHVLQPIEEYNGGVIYYSLGNFSFGGNTAPRDRDSAILRQEIIRDENGKVRLGELTIIPVSISSMDIYNNYQPVPYEKGTKEYDRTLSKLDGSFDGPDLVVDYSNLEKPTEPGAGETTPPETQPETGGSGGSGADGSGEDSSGGAGSGGDSSGGSGGTDQPAPPAGEEG